ncbi:MAG: DUF2306 domain-containing protein [Hyphomicrobium sp.]
MLTPKMSMANDIMATNRRRPSRALKTVAAFSAWRAAYAVILVLLIAPVGIVALGSAFGVIALPFEMHMLVKQMPVVFRAHMATSAVALLLAPVVIGFRHRPRMHRMLGRVLGAFVVLGGLTALPVAIFSHSGAVARAGFFTQGLVWMTLLVMGIAAIRNGKRERHRTLMLAMVAVTTGAVWFRVITGTAIALQLPFEATYATAAWLGWMIPLALVLHFQEAIGRTLARPPKAPTQAQPLAPVSGIV